MISERRHLSLVSPVGGAKCQKREEGRFLSRWTPGSVLPCLSLERESETFLCLALPPRASIRRVHVYNERNADHCGDSLLTYCVSSNHRRKQTCHDAFRGRAFFATDGPEKCADVIPSRQSQDGGYRLARTDRFSRNWRLAREDDSGPGSGRLRWMG